MGLIEILFDIAFSIIGAVFELIFGIIGTIIQYFGLPILIIIAIYYNIIWLGPSAASRGFRPSRAKATIRGATGWPLVTWAIKSESQTVSHPLVVAFGLSRLSLEFASPNRLNRQREKDGFRLQILYWGNERELCRY